MDTDNQPKLHRCKGPCARYLPRTREHFGYSYNVKDKMHGTCRKCLAARRAVLNEEKNKSQEIADKSHKDAFINVAARLAGAPHNAEVTELVYDALGGPRGFAAEFASTYFNAKENGQIHVQTRLLGMILQMTATNTAQGGAQKPLEILTDDELDSYIEERIRRLPPDLKLLEHEAIA